ncbi:MAG: hypothetical protein U9N61_07120 [Euryarchaeota archaeon]|nr:hypothetical protein [Euryarchaeota archaeon]
MKIDINNIGQGPVTGEGTSVNYSFAEFGVTRAVTSVYFRKLVEMELADKLGAGRSTRYRLKGPVESLSNRKVNSVNRKVKGKYGEE